jgi:hypothetical protein
MDTSSTRTRPFRFSEERQKRIYDRLLQLIGPEPAGFYRDACRLMSSDPPFDATTHLVGHALREIQGTLLGVCTVVTDAGGATSTESDEETKEKGRIKAILAGLGIRVEDPVAILWLKLAGRFHRWAHRARLAAPRPVDKEFQDFWEEFQVVITRILDEVEARITATVPLLDQLLSHETPTNEDVTKLKVQIPNNQVILSYFFEQLNHPQWLTPLRKAKFFSYPPNLIVDEDRGTVRLQTWPISRYLVRMAQRAQEHRNEEWSHEVLQAALSIPVSQNSRIEEDLLQVALSLPVEITVRLTDRLRAAMDSYLYHWVDPGMLMLVVLHLGRAGAREEAMSLLEGSLALFPDPRDPNALEPAIRSYFKPEPITRIRSYDYQQVLTEQLTSLVEVLEFPVFNMLVRLLDEALHLSTRDPQVQPADQSYLWRPTIETHDPDLASDEILNALVSAVRDSAIQLSASNGVPAAVLIDALESKNWTVFHRLALFVLSRFPTAAPDLTSRFLTTKQYFDVWQVSPEYWRLARESFSTLSRDAQGMILRWIEEGPTPPESVLNQIEHDTWDEEWATHKRQWQWKRLSWLAESLPDDWAEKYRALVAEFGEYDFSEHRPWRMVAVDPQVPASPKTAIELSELNVKELAGFLSDWKPSLDPQDGNALGLAAQLNILTRMKPNFIVSNADQFAGLDPIYIRAILQGLTMPPENDVVFPWEPLLSLFTAVVEQAYRSPQPAEASHGGHDIWRGIKWKINDMLSHGLRAGRAEIPIELRSEVWRILRLLSDDPDPTPEADFRDPDPNSDSLSHAINTIRGQALNLVVEYGLWVLRHVANQEGERTSQSEEDAERADPGPGGASFALMREVQEVLDRHLEIELDPSLAIRAIYGENLSYLTYLDADWVSRNMLRIFPQAENLQAYRESALHSYLTYSQPYTDVFPLIQTEYRWALDNLGSSTRSKRRADPEEGLAKHLMAHYWWGRLDLSIGGLLDTFFERASVRLRKYALDAIAPDASDNFISDEVRRRLEALWERRVKKVKGDLTSASEPEELTAFGRWFVSGKLDQEWSLTQLYQVLALTNGRMEQGSLVIGRLAELANADPVRAVDCINLMVDGVEEDWEIHAWRRKLYRAIETVLEGADEEARKKATWLANKLVARGQSDYVDLLSRSGLGNTA